MADELDDAVRLLGWTGDESASEETCAELERAHLTVVASRLNGGLDDTTRVRLDALPDAGYTAIVRGPDTFHAVYAGAPSALSARVARWIDVEAAAVGGPALFEGVARAAVAHAIGRMTRSITR